MHCGSQGSMSSSAPGDDKSVANGSHIRDSRNTTASMVGDGERPLCLRIHYQDPLLLRVATMRHPQAVLIEPGLPLLSLPQLLFDPRLLHRRLSQSRGHGVALGPRGSLKCCTKKLTSWNKPTLDFQNTRKRSAHNNNVLDQVQPIKMSDQ